MPASDVRFQRPDGMVCGLVGIRMTAAIEMIAAVMPVAARILAGEESSSPQRKSHRAEVITAHAIGIMSAR